MAEVQDVALGLVPALQKRRKEVLARWASAIESAARRRGHPPALLGSLAAILDTVAEGSYAVDLPPADSREIAAELSLLRVALRDLSPEFADAAADRLLEEAAAQIASRAVAGAPAPEGILTAPPARPPGNLLGERTRSDCGPPSCVSSG